VGKRTREELNAEEDEKSSPVFRPGEGAPEMTDDKTLGSIGLVHVISSVGTTSDLDDGMALHAEERTAKDPLHITAYVGLELQTVVRDNKGNSRYLINKRL
jgi:hypothetical protein